jgi:glycerol kinase
MSGSAILALDQGTTGSTALVVSQEGRVLSRAYSEFEQHFPRPGWVEHDAEEIWRVTTQVAREALDAPEVGHASVEAIGITNQRETLVLWDRLTLKPVHRAIVWQDRRTAPICSDLKAGGHEAEFRRRTGLVLDPYFTGTKLTWLLRERPDLRSRAEAGELAAGTVDAWLVARLTRGAVHATDFTNASRTLLYDLDEGGWSDRLLDLLEVPRPLLPEIRKSSGTFGVAAGEVLGRDLPILGVAGDQQSALYGQGCWEPGLAKNTYGTGAFLLMHTGAERVASTSGLLTTVACGPSGEPEFALEGAIFIAGAAIQWLRDGLGILEHAEESEVLARGLEGNDGVYLVPAFVGMGAPWWEPHARGTITGLTRGTGRAHLVRAALESMAYQTADVVGAMEASSGVPLEELRVDGGASRNAWLMEFQAGILGVPVHRAAIAETTAFGAAGLAGIAAGVWEGPGAFLSSRAAPTVFSPGLDATSRSMLRGGWRRAVHAALALGRSEAEGEG